MLRPAVTMVVSDLLAPGHRSAAAAGKPRRHCWLRKSQLRLVQDCGGCMSQRRFLPPDRPFETAQLRGVGESSTS